MRRRPRHRYAPGLSSRVRTLRARGIGPVAHIADATDQLATHRPFATAAAGGLAVGLQQLAVAWGEVLRRPDWSTWVDELAAAASAARDRDAELLTAASDPIHPTRVYGGLLPLLDDDAVVIGDGGDIVSYAGMFVSPS